MEACDLHKSFPTPGGEPIEILHGISCAMMPGRMTALVGPSGSGKSTALLCLAGLEPATSGRVSLMGRDFGGLPAARVAELYRDRVGFVFQAYNLVPYLTVRENITISDTLAGRRPDSARVPDWDWSRAPTRSRPRSRAVSSSASPWGGSSTAAHRSSSPTNPPGPSTPARPPSSWPSCGAWPTTGPPSSS